jgi:membrane-associated protease RseP (regulator of RpoE activity)
MTGLVGLEAPRTHDDHNGVSPVDGDGGGTGTPPGDVVRSNPLRLLAVVAGLVALGVFLGLPVLFLVVALILSIFLHEMGHFLVARRSGMLVTEFFIGMGPRIWSFRRGEVEYGLKAFPLGAYVRIVGMSNLEDVGDIAESRTFRSKNYPRRLATVVAGPAVNIAIGVVLFFALFVTTGLADPDDWGVGRVVDGGAAQAAGVQPGDRIVSVNGESVGDWEGFTEVLDGRAGQSVDLELVRDGETISTTAQLGWALSAAGVAALPTDPSLPVGAQVLSVDDQQITSYEQLVTALSGTGTATVEIEVGSGLYEAEMPLPVAMPADGARGFLGVSMGSNPAAPVGVVSAVGESVGMVGEVAGGMFDFLGRLFSPSGLVEYSKLFTGGSDEESTASDESLVPLQSVGDAAPIAPSTGVTSQQEAEIRPLSLIGIVQVGDQLSGVSGLESMIFLLAMVNVFLGLINLVPLLPFDGGHAVVATYEAVRGAIARRPYRVDVSKLMPLTYVVVFVLLGLGLSAMYLDIVDPVQLVP